MKTFIYPDKNTWAFLSTRPNQNQENLENKVTEIFKEIQQKGDAALLKYTLLFDHVNLTTFAVNQNEIENSCSVVSENLKDAIGLAKANIEKFHRSQRQIKEPVETSKGVVCWREDRPIETIGVYIPGGTAPLFSTVLMLGIPARIAGCKEIVLCTPPNKNGEIDPVILYTAQLIGITSIHKIGGIQAIGALTLGTESIQKVDKIFGPGNQYVTAAKQMAQKLGTAIDLPAGPSELLIIVDEFSVPEFIAADLLSQAEHGDDSQVVLVSDTEAVIKAVQIALENQVKNLPRKQIALAALKNSKLILLKDLDTCIEFSNFYAPEHLILAIENSDRLIAKISNAGSVFLGKYSCESAGDYASGTNHTLPTNGYAKSYSGVSLDSFVKKITFQEITKEGLQVIGPAIELMAEAEKLIGHKNAVSIRLKTMSDV